MRRVAIVFVLLLSFALPTLAEDPTPWAWPTPTLMPVSSDPPPFEWDYIEHDMFINIAERAVATWQWANRYHAVDAITVLLIVMLTFYGFRSITGKLRRMKT